MDREEILHRFEAWLDRTLAAEDPPQGIAAELLSSLSAETAADTDGQCDLHAMWSAVTGLTQEVKLQGRSFKQLSDTFAPLADMAPQLAEMQRQAQERARREMLDVLLDLRDRLGRGLASARASQTRMRDAQQSNWQARLLARHSMQRQASEGLAALVEGYRLSLERLDEALAQSDVREIDCQGQPFDPGRMYAVDVEETDRATDGTVVEVYRAGYEWKGQVHRAAQVKVARKPAVEASEDDSHE